MTTKTELLRHLEKVAWDEDIPEATRLQQIQGLLYQYEQMQDAHEYEWEHDLTPEDMGLPNMRRI